MTNIKQPEALEIAAWLSKWFGPDTARASQLLEIQHAKILEIEDQRTQELRAYELTVSNLRTKLDELEANAPQAVQPAVSEALVEAVNTLDRFMQSDSYEITQTESDAIGVLLTEAKRLHPAEGVPAPMPVAHPHHCTTRTADGSCEECEGHSQAMAEWNAERTALAATQPAAQGMLDAMTNAFITSESDGAAGSYKLVAKFQTLPELQAAHNALVTALAAQAKQGGADHG